MKNTKTKKPIYLESETIIKAKIYELISGRTGKENGITRLELSIATGLRDLDVRGYIKELREAGKVICSTSHVAGYYIPANEEEFLSYIREYKAKANRMIKIAEMQESQYMQQL